MNEKINISDYTKGMIKFDRCFDFESLLNFGFNLENLVTLNPNDRTETEIQTFRYNEIKTVRIVTEVETHSEGTLTYQSLYIYEKDKPYFEKLNKK